jgi:hypothetical protein
VTTNPYETNLGNYRDALDQLEDTLAQMNRAIQRYDWARANQFAREIHSRRGIGNSQWFNMVGGEGFFEKFDAALVEGKAAKAAFTAEFGELKPIEPPATPIPWYD